MGAVYPESLKDAEGVLGGVWEGGAGAGGRRAGVDVRRV
ncbi:hypothetical protein QF026_001821 [Streptomyces aurantiacus]|nr:hypothetical protein [Streptomyces aurantiacus]